MGEKTAGGYVCNWPVFEGIYQMLVRMLERSGQSVYLMLCTLVDGKGNPYAQEEILKHLAVYSMNLLILRTVVCRSRYGFRFACSCSAELLRLGIFEYMA